MKWCLWSVCLAAFVLGWLGCDPRQAREPGAEPAFEIEALGDGGPSRRDAPTDAGSEPPQRAEATPEPAAEPVPEAGPQEPQQPPEPSGAACSARDPQRFSSLDYGLYWFKDDGHCHKARPKGANPYYDPNKPTMLYIHGWVNGTTGRMFRSGFNEKHNKGPDRDMSEPWRKAGWNVGILYWNQFADEGEVKDAEGKVWSPKGPRKMRWRDDKEKYHDSGVPAGQSASELLARAYLAALRGHRAGEIRILGHSLGGQMTLAVCEKLLEEHQRGSLPKAAMPARLALLDPAFLKGKRDYLGDITTGERGVQAAQKIVGAGISLEIYRSSAATGTPFVGDANDALLKLAAFTELKPHYFQLWELVQKHMMAKWWYMWSLAFPPPPIEGSQETGASARASNGRIKALMTSDQKLVQEKGEKSQTPADDAMKEVKR